MYSSSRIELLNVRKTGIIIIIIISHLYTTEPIIESNVASKPQSRFENWRPHLHHRANNWIIGIKCRLYTTEPITSINCCLYTMTKEPITRITRRLFTTEVMTTFKHPFTDRLSARIILYINSHIWVSYCLVSPGYLLCSQNIQAKWKNNAR